MGRMSSSILYIYYYSTLYIHYYSILYIYYYSILYKYIIILYYVYIIILYYICINILLHTVQSSTVVNCYLPRVDPKIPSLRMQMYANNTLFAQDPFPSKQDIPRTSLQVTSPQQMLNEQLLQVRHILTNTKLRTNKLGTSYTLVKKHFCIKNDCEIKRHLQFNNAFYWNSFQCNLHNVDFCIWLSSGCYSHARSNTQ